MNEIELFAAAFEAVRSGRCPGLTARTIDVRGCGPRRCIEEGGKPLPWDEAIKRVNAALNGEAK